jgi:hypothetical protein
VLAPLRGSEWHLLTIALGLKAASRSHARPAAQPFIASSITVAGLVERAPRYATQLVRGNAVGRRDASKPFIAPGSVVARLKVPACGHTASCCAVGGEHAGETRIARIVAKTRLLASAGGDATTFGPAGAIVHHVAVVLHAREPRITREGKAGRPARTESIRARTASLAESACRQTRSVEAFESSSQLMSARHGLDVDAMRCADEAPRAQRTVPKWTCRKWHARTFGSGETFH